MTWGGSMIGGLRGGGMGTNGDGSIMGGDGTLGTMGGNSRITGGGPIGVGAIAGTDEGASGMITVGPPVPPEGLGLGMNTGDGDLPLNVLLRLLRSVRSPSRNV